MTTDQTPPNDTRAPVWPQGGYAPGSYWCKCVSCNQQFTGDKRAYQCPDCIIQALASHSAAREAAAALGMREEIIKSLRLAITLAEEWLAGAIHEPWSAKHDKWLAGQVLYQEAIEYIDHLPLPDTSALDRLIAEARREAVEATWRDVEAALEKEINAEWFTSEVNGKPVTSKGETEFMRLTEAKRVFDMLKANVRAARGSKEGQP